MMRQLMILSVVALVAAPDWATAFGRRRFRCAPVPVAYCPPAYVIVPPCLPAFDVYPVAPVVPAPALASPPTVTSEPARPEPAKPDPLPKVPVLSPPKVQVDPTPDAPVRPVEFTPAAPSRSAAVPSVPGVGPGGLHMPPPAAGAAHIPPTQVPMGTVPPVPDPAALAPRFPAEADGLPALGLPTLPGVTAKSSPLSGGARVDIIPVDGAQAVGAATRTVGFFNLTDRNVILTVEGHTVSLPAKHQIAATVPAGFRWKFGDGDEQKTTVPAGAAGVEVVLRR